MNASDYLKLKFKADKALGLVLEKGIKATATGAYNTLNDVYYGIERASWYSSCIFEKYQDICQELGHEDIRMIKAIKQLFKHADIIAFMLELYVNYKIIQYKKEPEKSTRSMTENMTGVAGSLATGRATNKIFSHSIAEAVAYSVKTTAAVKSQTGNIGMVWFTAAQMYGRNQKAAMAARRLRMYDPGYYNILYKADIEMLYIFIEPIISAIIKEIKSAVALSTEDILKIVREKL